MGINIETTQKMVKSHFYATNRPLEILEKDTAIQNFFDGKLDNYTSLMFAHFLGVAMAITPAGTTSCNA